MYSLSGFNLPESFYHGPLTNVQKMASLEKENVLANEDIAAAFFLWKRVQKAERTVMWHWWPML